MRALVLLLAVAASPASRAPQVGDRYEIVRHVESASTDSNGGSGSTYDHDTFVERVVGTSAAGIEIEFDLSDDATAENRAGEWILPARILKPATGPLQLLNKAELEARLTVWLKKAEIPREMCGRYIFTWNAFKIECDPQAAVEIFEALDLSREPVRAGAPYQIPRGRGISVLRETGANTYTAEAAIDPAPVLRERAEADVFVAELNREPMTLEAALKAREREEISGTITVTFNSDASGIAWRRTQVTKMRIKEPDGKIENSTITRTVERKLLPRPS